MPSPWYLVTRLMLPVHLSYVKTLPCSIQLVQNNTAVQSLHFVTPSTSIISMVDGCCRTTQACPSVFQGCGLNSLSNLGNTYRSISERISSS